MSKVTLLQVKPGQSFVTANGAQYTATGEPTRKLDVISIPVEHEEGVRDFMKVCELYPTSKVTIVAG